jgi:chitin disaccharide deacetylase
VASNEVKRLIVSADDVGLSPGIGAGAVEALHSGIVTSLSVMTAVDGWEATVKLLKGAEVPDIGVHLTLCEGVPVLPPHEVPSLLGPGGRFPGDLGGVLMRLVTGQIRLSEVLAEWTAQVRRAQDAGLPVTHLDGHKHIHVAPRLGRVCAAVAATTGVRGVRLPRQRRGPRPAVRWGLAAASAVHRRLGRAPDRCVGIGVAGRLDEALLLSTLAGLRPGTTELITHPGLPGPGLGEALAARGMAWGRDYGFGRELAALTSPRVRRAVDEAGVELISWGEFLD